jgi:UDP-glucose 4-epimerase
MAILVTGGAGYIGSVMVGQLVERGEEVVVLDDLSRGHRAAVPDAATFYGGRTGDAGLVKKICADHAVDACIHFAALAYVGESVNEPRRNFENNVAQGTALLGALLDSGVRRIVFSSTCATYGEPVRVPIDESHPQAPTNPYGWSKFFFERILEAYNRAYGLEFVALRYFNASGAAGAGGEDHEPETHLIPNILAAAAGKLSHVSVFGGDYPTPDGTAIRDYIHVSDLCKAHTLALEYLRGGGESTFINLGTGSGYSVMEVIDAARRVSGREIEARIEPARPGDPSRLVAEAEKARRVLGWEPEYTSLDAIIETAWAWHESHPDGYGDE